MQYTDKIQFLTKKITSIVMSFADNESSIYQTDMIMQ